MTTNLRILYQDERLKEGVAKHKVEGWAKVAEYVGDGVTAFQCKYRWNTYHGAMQYGNVKRGPWDQEEVGTVDTKVIRVRI